VWQVSDMEEMSKVDEAGSGGLVGVRKYGSGVWGEGLCRYDEYAGSKFDGW